MQRPLFIAGCSVLLMLRHSCRTELDAFDTLGKCARAAFEVLDTVGELESLIAAHAAAGGAVLLTTHHRLGLANGLRRLMLGQQMVD